MDVNVIQSHVLPFYIPRENEDMEKSKSMEKSSGYKNVSA